MSSQPAPALIEIKKEPPYLARPWIYWPVGILGVLLGSFLLGNFIKKICADPINGPNLRALGTNLLDPDTTDLYQALLILAAAVLAWYVPRLGRAGWLQVESWLSRVANHRLEVVLLTGLLPILIRLALLPVLGVPAPVIADEFGNLLIADTFASGRVTNPPHPMWKYLEETYTLHQPSYTSVYPIGPAVFMAAAKLAHASPWLGVCLAAGLMCGAICWCLQGWVPPRWALLGGLMADCRFSAASPWINTYWGGAVAAFGGALALGALGRILRSDHLRRNSLLFGAGLAVLAQSRPYEGAAFSIPLLSMLAIWFAKDVRTSLAARIRQVAQPLALCAIVTLAGMAYYNWRVTGNALLLPPQLQRSIYGMPQTFLWQPPILDAPRIHQYKEISDVFHWQLEARQTGLTWDVLGARLQVFWQFFLQPVLTLPLLVLAWRTRERWPWWIASAVVLLLLANFLYPFFFPHYAAPACAALFLLAIEGLRYLRTLRWFGRPAGAIFARYLVSLTFLSGAAFALGGLLLPGAIVQTESGRTWVAEQLKKEGGSHLVLVRYNPNHSLHYPIVYNDADIDHSPIVWAHQTDRAGDQELTNYFNDREVWYFNPDQLPFKLVPLIAKPFISEVVNGAGWRDDRRQGVSPGGMAVILGGNFSNENGVSPRGAFLGGLPVELKNTSEKTGDVFEPMVGRPYKEAESAGLPLRLNDVSVQFNGLPAPIYSVSKIAGHEALTVQVPFEAPVGLAEVRVSVGKRIATGKVLVLPVSPGILEIERPDATRQAIVLRSDGTLVDQAHPARRGETLHCYVTGLGPLKPAVKTDQVGGTTVDDVANPIVLGIHHAGIPVLYARYAPGLVGVEEIGFKVPAEAPSGAAEPFAIAVLLDGQTVFGNSSWIPVK